MYYTDIEDWVEMHPGSGPDGPRGTLGEPRVTIHYEDLRRYVDELTSGPFWYDELGRVKL